MNQASHNTIKSRTVGARHRNVAALAVLIFAGLNLNHVVSQLTGIRALLWPVVIFMVLAMSLRYARSTLSSDVYALFIAFLGSYLISATLTGLAKGNVEWILFASYLATLAFVSGLYFWLAGQDGADISVSLNFFKIVLLASCIAVLLSPYLGANFGFAGERASGLFEDPNEAAVVALYCLVLVAAYPSRNSLITAAQAAVALFALIVTFSKAGLLILIVLAFLALIEKRSMLIMGITIIVFAAATWEIGYFIHWDAFDLSAEHRERLAAIPKILSGEITPETTTGRTLLWKFALQKIELQLPWGAGLGEFHHMEGSYRSPRHEWLGVHNIFLLVLGEGGLLPFLLLVLFVLRLLATAYQARERKVAIGFAIVLVGDMLSTHSLLGSRVSAVSLAAAMAIASGAALRRRSSLHV